MCVCVTERSNLSQSLAKVELHLLSNQKHRNMTFQATNRPPSVILETAHSKTPHKAY